MAHNRSEQRAVKNWVADTFSGATQQVVAGTRWQDCVVFAQRPKFQVLGTNVMITVGDVSRKTERIGMGRPTGLKRHSYEINVLVQATDADAEAGGNDFDQVMDQVDLILEAVTLEVVITDAADGSSYRISKIAEEIDSRTHSPETTARGGLVTFTGSKVFTCWVHYNE